MDSQTDVLVSVLALLTWFCGAFLLRRYSHSCAVGAAEASRRRRPSANSQVYFFSSTNPPTFAGARAKFAGQDFNLRSPCDGGEPWVTAASRAKINLKKVSLARISIGSTQPIPDAGFGQNVLRPLGIGIDLLPKLPHIDPHILRICQIIPQFVE